MIRPGFVPDEQRQCREARGNRPEHVRPQPGPGIAALDDPVDHQHQPGDRQQYAGVVHPARIRASGLRHQDDDRDDADCGERNVDEEDRAPPEVIQEQAADDRPDGDGHADGRRPDSDGARPLRRLEDVRDDRQGLRHDRGAAETHRRPGPDELVRALRVGAQQRENAEQGHADDQHPPPPDPVAHHAEGEQQAGEDQRVGIDRPLELALARAEAGPGLGNGLQRDVEDRVVQHDRGEADDQDAEDEPAMALTRRAAHSRPPDRAGRAPGLRRWLAKNRYET